MDTIPQKPTVSLAVGIIITVVVVALAVGGYFYWKDTAQTPEEEAADAVTGALQSAAQGALPNLTPTGNPAQKLPEVNPVTKTNPFKSTYQNPFE